MYYTHTHTLLFPQVIKRGNGQFLPRLIPGKYSLVHLILLMKHEYAMVECSMIEQLLTTI